jgi:hypothetical protein
MDVGKIAISYLGWNKEGTHDKIYALFMINSTKFVAIWGRRTATNFSYKIYDKYEDQDIFDLMRKKKDKGYRDIIKSRRTYITDTIDDCKDKLNGIFEDPTMFFDNVKNFIIISKMMV